MSVRLSLAAVLVAFGSVAARAGLSEPHGHDHRAVSGRRPDRPARARAGAEILREARAEFHRRERQRRRHHDRDRAGRARGAGRPHAAAAQSADFGERRALSEARLRHREGPHAGRVHQPESAGAGRPQNRSRRTRSRASRLDEDDAAEDGASRHRQHRPSRHLAARQGGEGRGRARALSRRRAGVAGHRRRPCRSVLRHAAIGGAERRRRTDEGLRHHREGDRRRSSRSVASFVEELGPKLEILYWHAMFVPAGTPKAIVDKLSARAAAA